MLREYSSASPYVALSEWFGIACDDCDVFVHLDDLSTCNHCEHSYCDDCSTGCMICDDTYCWACTCVCDLCGDRYCKPCAATCAHCADTCCSGCVEDDVCSACREELEEQNEPDTQETATKEPATTGSAA